MGETRERIVNTRLGRVVVTPERTVRFPRGLIGFERMRQFALLEVDEKSPFMLLQSLEEPGLGFLLTNPYPFVNDYKVKIGNAEQGILQAKSLRDLCILVTVTIPSGRPEHTTLNLTGPVVINTTQRIGLQIPQVEQDYPSHFELKEYLPIYDQKSPSSSSNF